MDHESLTPIDHERVGLGSEVLYIGYPANCYDRTNNLALTRKGSLASLPWINFDGKGQLVIDGHVYPGSSGSPVFIDYDQKYKLLGVLSHAFTYRESSEETYSGLCALIKRFFMGYREPSEKTYLGLGIVIKQEHVRELIRYAHDEIIQKIKLLDSIQHMKPIPISDLINDRS